MGRVVQTELKKHSPASTIRHYRVMMEMMEI